MNSKLEFRIIDRGSHDLADIQRLYERSFPENERIPFHILLKQKRSQALFFSVYECEKLVGLYHIFLGDEVNYLSYICVDHVFQDQGAGTAILKHIHDTYADKPIVVDIEEVNPDDDNYIEEVRRRLFYEKNGYTSTGIFYHFFDVDYELLSYGGIVSRQMWIDLTLKIWGQRAKGARYKGR